MEDNEKCSVIQCVLLTLSHEMLCENACSTTTGSAPQLFLSALNFFATSQCFIEMHSYDVVHDQETFDFIIVGGGSAGSVVAKRLSEIKHWNILLLEAGPEPPIESDIPNMDGTLYRTKYDWQYVTKSDGIRHQALKNGEVRMTRGKMLGGCSSINAMFYVRGRDSDFQSWSDGGNPSWSPESVKRYFKKAENFQDMKLNNDPNIQKAYGHKGPLIINSFNTTYRKVTEKILDSWDHIGIKKVTDINVARYQGYGLSAKLRVTATNGKRQSTYRAYLNTERKNQNLKIITNAFVTKILINANSQAYGIEINVNGTRQRFLSNLEVIISAGTINTPQLLMLSGIGPEEHLLSKNISCKNNLSGVGKNFQDHNFIPVPIFGDEPGPQHKADINFDILKYIYNRTGYLAQGNIADSSAIFSRFKDMKYPEFQSHLVLFPKNSSTVRQFLDTFTNEVIDSITRHSSDKALYMFSLHILHPFSRGAIYLNTSNPNDHPIIDANYLGDYRDIQSSIDGIKIISNLLNTPYFKSINAFIPRIDLPQCNQYDFPSDHYWKCYSLQMSTTLFHPVGTAKMGPDPKDSVVDNYLKVHGVRRLRVIDASVMPYITSGNTNAPTIMIGEMASDMIKAQNLNYLN